MATMITIHPMMKGIAREIIVHFLPIDISKLLYTFVTERNLLSYLYGNPGNEQCGKRFLDEIYFIPLLDTDLHIL